MQKITIRQFGPIPSCELDIKPFMILIGEQSTGKSTICKCIYFFKSVRDVIKSYLHGILSTGSLTERRFPSSLNTELKSRFVDLFGMSKFKGDFYLKYEYGPDASLEITSTNDEHKYLNFQFSSVIIQNIQKLEEIAKQHYQDALNIKDVISNELFFDLEIKRVYMLMEKEINKLFNDISEHYYIPAGRGLLTLLSNQLLNIELKSLDYITRDFLKLIQRERNTFEQGLINIINNSDKRDLLRKHNIFQKMTSILKGNYYIKRDKEYIRFQNGFQDGFAKNRVLLPINYASSGQQEVLWILNLLFVWMQGDKRTFVVIEEPEAHLFPNAQKELIDFIALFANLSNSEIMITTHSPYILTCVNNLLYAGKVGERYEEVSSIVPKEYWIHPSSFGAFILGGLNSQFIRSIVDEELHEIAAENIDQVSASIRMQYSRIFELEADNEFSE
ncbi:Putative uncharacterized protein [Thermobacillus xylanilyticus]|jgi:AAA15 family ATPase/GTPase|uniref:Endonuclease GajA/Old nuclease/RecF-like AAA domain-containing protein n=1 Tax=Thermobacillus xylanilyticus TaxID=76633 RepID=A0ABN7SA90_THEXY|nr:AAA family ATPase [Thermobacillus xylanilyticus]CAG5092993.1 Putative uncharacterized protein [Thermobacillus xylanilyticus]